MSKTIQEQLKNKKIIIARLQRKVNELLEGNINANQIIGDQAEEYGKIIADLREQLEKAQETVKAEWLEKICNQGSEIADLKAEIETLQCTTGHALALRLKDENARLKARVLDVENECAEQINTLKVEKDAEIKNLREYIEVSNSLRHLESINIMLFRAGIESSIDEVVSKSGSEYDENVIKIKKLKERWHQLGAIIYKEG